MKFWNYLRVPNHKKYGLRKPVLPIGTKLIATAKENEGDGKFIVVKHEEHMIRNKRKIFYILSSGSLKYNVRVPGGKLRFNFQISKEG